ncbi:MFS transporter [Vibrio europaeus]|uniref:MFS transporter n=1 Tax=Vibrio europaeus TaxID=300876 RepID=A0A178JGC3_9VIBR|nr:MFS transporter [Vibrio europaeus]MDC5706891.1 MFS transporter [Vibrio europaeus]MDC5712256.1 MFS transporter [Vibrio europaeus]MDC5716899.1 MFS transporter [Vibrio europaeus]MDC5721567.1 MFS transporter [Vibrio europaeus]MDC5726198.1 MFS transporter [Vibrio europaeus]
MSLTWKQRSSAVLGNAMEFYDIAVFASISIYISQLFATQGIEHSEFVVWGVFALRFLVRPFGGIIIGRYADKYGRKRALVFCNLLTGIATVAMAFVPVEIVGQYVVVVFLFFQMIQSFSFGGEYPTLINYLLYDAKKTERSRVSSLIVASSIVGVIISLLIVAGLESVLSAKEMSEWGWRVPLLVGVANIIVSLYLRLSLPELPKAEAVASKSSRAIIAKVFCISILGAVVFYVQNLASGILGKAMNIDNLALINSSILVVMLFAFAMLVDKRSSPTKAFKIGALLMLFSAVPLFALLGSNQFVWQALAVLGISSLAAIILGNLAALLWQQSDNQTTSLGIGYNIALSIFGGLTPLIVTEAMLFSPAYVGVYVAIATIPGLTVLYRFNAQTLQKPVEA